MEMIQPEGDAGVVVGRFQVPYLHEAHVDLIETVKKHHRRVAVFLGSPVVTTRCNPMTFEPRCQMIQERFPDVVVLPIADVKYDDVWVDALERQIDLLFPTNTVVLYGSRESFVACYKKVYDDRNKRPRRAVVELRSEVNISGTQLRSAAANSVLGNEAFRTGVIFGLSNRFRGVHLTVDFALVRPKGKIGPDESAAPRELLLAKRSHERKYRFPGGFVDPEDSSLEIAVRRECGQETQASIHYMKYLGSVRVDDWRYRGTGDAVMTTLFEAPMLYGPTIAGDDVDEVRWFDWSDLSVDLVEPEHAPLMRLFLDANARSIGYQRAERAKRSHLTSTEHVEESAR